MNDPFASLDPMRSERADVEKRLTNPTFSTAPSTGNAASNPFGPSSPLSNPQLYPHANSSGAQSMGYPYQMQGGFVPVNNTHPYNQGPHVQEWNNKPTDPFSTQAASHDTCKNYLGSDSQAYGGMIRDPESTRAPLKTCLSDIIVDFDPFSPRDSTPQFPFNTSQRNSQQQIASGGAHVDRGGMRQTQEEVRASLALNSEAFNPATSARISLREISQEGSQKDLGSRSENDDFMVVENAFPGQLFANLDDFAGGSGDWSQYSKQTNFEDTNAEDCIPEKCAQNEYDCTFETGYKLGVLMERVDVYGRDRTHHQEIAVVKLVVENGAADHLGVSVGSSVVAINRKNLEKESYATVLEMIRLAPRPMTVRFKRGTVNKDTTQGVTLTRISNGTFSVGNLTSGNATWDQKYFAFGGSRMDVLQLFISRAAYHECVISLYEKRPVHTQIQSFRLCQDHKISPIKSKIYKGYGNLHYFSLTVPSLRFIAAKFASEDYETIRNLWSNTYDAIERKKRHQ